MADPATIIIGVVKVVKTAAAAWKTFAAAHKIAATAIKIAAVVAASKALTPKPKGYANSGQQLDFIADPRAGCPILFGRTATAGTLAFQRPSGPNNKHLNMLGAVTGCGPADAFESFQMTRVGSNWNNATGQVTNGKFRDRMWLKTALGVVMGAAALTQPAMPATDSPLPEWSSAHKMTGFAQFWLDAEYDGEIWTEQMEPRFVVRGVMCYDPRYDDTFPGGVGPQRIDDPTTWVYSENPIIVGLTYYVGWSQVGANGRRRVGGVGIPPAGIDLKSFADAANVAQLNGWKCGGVITTLADKWETGKQILKCASAEPVTVGGILSCRIDAPRTSLYTVTAADLAGPFSVPATQSMRDRLNSIIPSYRSEAHLWEIVPAAPVTVTAYQALDKGLRQKEIEYSFCQHAKQAAELAAYDLVNAREFGPVALSLKPHMIGFKPGDAITLNLPEAGLNNQLVVIRSRGIDPDTGAVTLTVVSETTAKHAFALGQSANPPPTPGLTTPDFATVPAPLEGQWTAALGTDTSGLPSIIVAGMASDNRFASEVIIEYRSDSSGPWKVWATLPATATRAEITGLASATAYEVAVSYRSIYGVVGARRAVGSVTTGETSIGNADDTTHVGGRPAEELLDQLDDATTAAADATMTAAAAWARADEAFDDAGDALAQIGAVANRLTDLSGALPWNAATNYVPGNQVTSGGHAWQAIAPNTNVAPPNGAYWKDLGLYSATGLALRVTENVQELVTQDGKITAVTGTANVIKASIRNAAACPNRLYNSTFAIQGATYAEAAGWNEAGTNTDRISRHNYYNDAGWSMYFSHDGIVVPQNYIYSDEFNMSAGPTCITGRMYQNNLGAGYVEIYLVCYDAAHAQIGGGVCYWQPWNNGPVNGATTGWQNFAIPLQDAPAGTEYCRLFVNLINTGTGAPGQSLLVVSKLKVSGDPNSPWTDENTDAVTGQITQTQEVRLNTAEGEISAQGLILSGIQLEIPNKASVGYVDSAVLTVKTDLEGDIEIEGDRITALSAQLLGGSDNLVVNSGFDDGLTGWVAGWNGNTGTAIHRGRNWPDTNWWGVANNIGAKADGSPANGTVFDIYGMPDLGVGGIEAVRRYCVPVNDGQRLFVSCYAAIHRAAGLQPCIQWLDGNGNAITEVAAATGGYDGGGGAGNPSNMTRLGGFVAVPAGARYARMFFRVVCNGLNDPYGFVIRPMIAYATASQTAWPEYVPGPSNRVPASAEVVSQMGVDLGLIDGEVAAIATSLEAVGVQVDDISAEGLISMTAVAAGGEVASRIAILTRMNTGDAWKDAGLHIEVVQPSGGAAYSRIILKSDQLVVTDGSGTFSIKGSLIQVFDPVTFEEIVRLGSWEV